MISNPTAYTFYKHPSFFVTKSLIKLFGSPSTSHSTCLQKVTPAHHRLSLAHDPNHHSTLLYGTPPLAKNPPKMLEKILWTANWHYVFYL